MHVILFLIILETIFSFVSVIYLFKYKEINFDRNLQYYLQYLSIYTYIFYLRFYTKLIILLKIL